MNLKHEMVYNNKVSNAAEFIRKQYLIISAEFHDERLRPFYLLPNIILDLIVGLTLLFCLSISISFFGEVMPIQILTRQIKMKILILLI